MKKLVILIIIMISITMVLLSEEKEVKNQLNNYIITFQLQKITYQGIQGFFLPEIGYRQLLFLLNDYIFTQNMLSLRNNMIEELKKYEKNNFYLKNGLGISIGVNISLLFLCVGTGFLIYSIK